MLTKKCILLICLCLSGIAVKAQDSPSSWNAKLKMYVYNSVEKWPSFPGGEDALVKAHKVHQISAKSEGFTKFNSFIVDSSGNLLDKRVANKDVSAYTLLDKEGIAMLDKMPKWIPGEQIGRKVAVKFQLPIYIGLQE